MTVRAFRLTATGLLALGACRGGSGGPKVTLRYHPRAGTAYHYALDQQNTMSVEGGPMGALGEQAFRMRLFYTQTVVGPAQGAEGGVAVPVNPWAEDRWSGASSRPAARESRPSRPRGASPPCPPRRSRSRCRG